MDDQFKKYLFDMLESIKSIDSYLSGKRIFEDYLKNKMLRRAIEREFEIMVKPWQNLINLILIFRCHPKGRSLV